jgi:PKD repeat protein
MSRWLGLGLGLGLGLVGCDGADGTEVPDEPAPAVAVAGPVPVGFVGEALSVDGTSSVGDCRWSFGDGSAEVAGCAAAHTYGAPGTYGAVLTVRGEGGDEVSEGLKIEVVHRPLAEAPRQSGPLQRDGDRLFVAVADAGRLAVVSITGVPVADVVSCGEPSAVAVETRVVAVSCAADQLALHPRDGDLIGPPVLVDLPWGSRPGGVVLDGGTAWVALEGKEALAKVDVVSQSVAVVPLGLGPRALAVSEGVVVAAGFRVGPDGAAVAAVGPGDAVSRWPLAEDPGPDSDTGSRGVPNLLGTVAPRPDGRAAWVGGLRSNRDRGLFLDGQAPLHDRVVRPTVRTLALSAAEGVVGAELDQPLFDDRDLASVVAFDPLGTRAFVAFLGAEIIEIIDPYDLTREMGLVGMGSGITGLASDGRFLFVWLAHEGALVGWDLDDPNGATEVFRVDLSGDALEAEVMRGRALFHRADRRMTQASYLHCGVCHPDGADDGITWDFTDRGEGLRNTRPLWGTGDDPIHWSANFDELQDFENDIRGPQAGLGFLDEADWAATMDTLGPPKAGLSEELDDLAAYIQHLSSKRPRSPHRDANGGLSDEAQAGEALFLDEATGCADCHPPPHYSDSAWLSPGVPLLHDVGTLLPSSGKRRGGLLEGIDTPSLRGAFATGPWLHDGRAARLKDVFTVHDPLHQHGHTEGLTGEELDQLEAFVLSIE